VGRAPCSGTIAGIILILISIIITIMNIIVIIAVA
jgi:hypothetical protein